MTVGIDSRFFDSHVRPAEDRLTEIIKAVIYVAHSLIAVLETT